MPIRLILITLFSSIETFASGWFAGFADKLPVYVIGDASGMADGFNFVAMIVNSSALQGIILVGVMVALVRVSMKLYAHSAEGSIAEFLYIIFVLFFFLTPSTSVIVQDARIYKGGMAPPDVNTSSVTGYVSAQTIDNIPSGIALIASFSTTIGWDLAALVDTVIAPVIPDGEYLGVTKAGINQPAKDMRWILNNIASGIAGEKGHHDYEYMLNEYVQTCALPTVSLDVTNSQKIVSPPDGDYMRYLSPTELPVAGTSIFDPITQTTVDCKDFWNNNLNSAVAAFENNVLQQFRDYKKFDVGGSNTQSENALRYLVNSYSTSAIANFKDMASSLKRASVVAGAISASSTGIGGVDMSNRMAMTASKQNMMVQGPAQFAWLGEVLPLAINISFGFLIVMSVLMAIFLLFQGWIKGIKVILNFASGFFALSFSYVSLAVTQGIVNRHAFAKNAEHYISQGSPLQVTNYDFLLEQAATMDGLTGLLGSLFVAAGTAVVFYGESKMLVNGIMGKVAGSFAGNNLDQTLDDNAKDTALATSMAEAERRNKMAGKLTDAGIAHDGGNIEFEYAKMQKELSDIGAARGSHMAITEGDTSAEATGNRVDMIAGAGMQSFEKSKSLQGYGHQALKEGGGNLDKAMDLVSEGAFAKGRGSAAASLGESALLQSDAKADAFVEGVKRDAQINTAKTIGTGKAEPEGGMSKYLDNIEKDGTVAFLAKGIKAEAAADRGLAAGSDSKIDADYGEGIYRTEASNIESTKMKSRVNDSREDYIKNSAANAFKHEAEGQAMGSQIRGRFGDDLMGLASSVPYAGEKLDGGDKSENGKIEKSSAVKKPAETNKTRQENEEIKKTPLTKAEKEEVRELFSDGKMSGKDWDKFNTIDKKHGEALSLVRSAINYPAITGIGSPAVELDKVPEIAESAPSMASPKAIHDSKSKIGLPFSKEATAEEKKLMRETGMSLEDVRKNKDSIVSHESDGSLQKRLGEENQLGFIGMAQFGAAALSDVGLVNRDRYMAATHKTSRGGRAWNRGMNRKKFLADDKNWNLEGGKEAFMSSFEVQDDALSKLMTQNASTLKRVGVNLGDSSHTKGLLMASHLAGAGNAARFAKKGIGFRDANGTSIGAYYHAGAHDITKKDGWGGKINSSGGGVRNTNTGSMGIKEIAASHARKGLDEWVATGQSIANTFEKDPSAYATAAAFREAGAMMTSQSIESKGGLDAAISQGVMNAASEGSGDRGAFVGRATQQLVASGMNPQDAKKLAESIANGSEQGAQKFKEAIMSASAAKSVVTAAEQEGLGQMHAKNLKSNFGETLTEKESKASGKTFTQEQEAISTDSQTEEKKAWDKRKEALETQKSELDFFSGDEKRVAASYVGSVLNQVIDGDSSLNNAGRVMKKQSVSTIMKDIEGGKEVTTKEIKSALGDSIGEKGIEALEKNGVLFEDAEGWGTGDKISAGATGKKIKDFKAAQIITGALAQQQVENEKLFASGEISQDEYSSRSKKLQYLQMGASGKNGGSMPMEYFEDAGFTQESLKEYGIKKGKTDRANLIGRSFQISHIDTNSVLGAAQDRIDESLKKEQPEHSEPVKSEKSTPSAPKEESSSHSWSELADAQENKKVQEFIGSGSGIIENTAKNPNVYSENAMYGEMSKAGTTQAKLDAQGGIHKAVAVDTAESSIKAASQKGGVTEQAAQLAGGGEEGKKIADAIKNGSAEGADLLAAGIVRAAQNLGAAQSGARTRGDLSQVSATGGTEAFIEAAGVEGAKRGITSRVQNIDMGAQDIADAQVQGILSTTKTADRAKVLESLKNYGMVTEDSSIEGGVTATTGEKFLRGKAQAAAATMGSNDKLSFAGYSYQMATDSTTGETRVEATNASGLTTGKYVHDKTGIRVDNPVQMLQSKAGIDTTDAYTGSDSDGDGGSDGAGSVSGNAAIGIAGASTVAGVYALANGKSKRVDRAFETAKHKFKGDVRVGNDFYNKKDMSLLEDSGIVQKDSEGKYTYKEGMSAKEGKVVIQESLSRPTVSAGILNQRYTNNPINPTETPIKNDVNIDSPSKNSDKVNEKPLSGSNNNENTSRSQGNDRKSNNLTPEAKQKLDSIDSQSSKELGKEVFREKAVHQQQTVREQLFEATRDGNEAKVAKLSEQDGALKKVIKSIDADQPVKASLAKTAGIPTNHTSSPDGKPFNETVDFESVGDTEKVVQGAKVASDPSNHIPSNETRADTPKHSSAVKEGTPSHGIPMPKTRAGKILGMLSGGALAGALFSSDAEAKELPGFQRTITPEDGSATLPMNSADMLGLGIQGGFNALNAKGALDEIRGGASKNIGDLGKASSYTDGFRTVARDAVDFSDFKGISKGFAEEGAVEAAKLGGKALGKSAMKKMPLFGVAAGAAFAVERAESGDYIGAAMEFASGAVSLIPGIGTAASVAIDGALMKRDYDEAHSTSAPTQAVPSTSTPASGGSIAAPVEQSIDTTSKVQSAETSSVEPQRTVVKERVTESAPASMDSPAERFDTLSSDIASMSNEEAGVSYISTVAPREAVPQIIKEANAGMLTPQRLVEHGVPQDIAQTIPVDENGTTSMSQMGEMYKVGTSHLAGALAASENPSVKYGNGLGSIMSSGNISPAAASSLEAAPVEQSIDTTSKVQSAETSSVEPQRTVVKERVTESAPASMDSLSDLGSRSEGNEVQEFARNATSPGNLQTSSSDIKRSIDDVSAAMENAKSAAAQASPEQIDLNALALGDFAAGMALNAPIQTTTGELTMGHKDGYLTLGQGEGAVRTPIPSEIIQNAPADTVDKFAATLSNSKLTNESVAQIANETEYGSIGMGSTAEMLYEMSTEGRKTSLDARISGGDQVSLLEDLVDNMEKMQSSLIPIEEKKEI